MVIFDEKGNLVHAKGTNLTTKNSLEGEAMAVFGALNYIMEGSIGRYRIYSDCKILVQAIERESINELTHWQAVRVVVRCIQLCKDLRDMVSIKHVRRNALIQPHALANWATRQNSTFAGVPGQQFMGNCISNQSSTKHSTGFKAAQALLQYKIQHSSMELHPARKLR